MLIIQHNNLRLSIIKYRQKQILEKEIFIIYFNLTKVNKV